MPDFSKFNAAFEAYGREEKPRYKTLSITTARRGDYVDLQVIDNSNPGFILVKNMFGETLIISLDKMIIKAQHGHDKHFMTTVGASFTVKADTHHAYTNNNFYVWRLAELRYGLEIWDRGFRY